jgi:hypothetical protein
VYEVFSGGGRNRESGWTAEYGGGGHSSADDLAIIA